MTFMIGVVVGAAGYAFVSHFHDGFSALWKRTEKNIDDTLKGN